MAAQGLQPVDSATVNSYAQDLRQLLKEADLIERKSFLRSFIRRIEVDKGQVSIYYILPLPPDEKDREQMGVLPIVTSGGDRGIRTPDLCDANAALSQLSYIPTGN